MRLAGTFDIGSMLKFATLVTVL